MSQDNSVHPLDQEYHADGDQGRNELRSPASKRLSGFLILAILGGIFLLITLAGAALINSSANAQSDRLGTWLWQSGAIGMLVCCSGILVLNRSKQLIHLAKGGVWYSSLLHSSFFGILIWSLGFFLLLSLLLTLLHLTFGSFRILYYQQFIYPFAIAIVLSLIGTTYRESRAFWIGFATSIFLGIYGYNLNQFWMATALPPQARASVLNNGPNPMYGTGRGLGINVPNASPFTGGPAYAKGTIDYRFEFRVLMTQLSTLGMALFTGVLCSGVVAVSLGIPKKPEPIPTRTDQKA